MILVNLRLANQYAKECDEPTMKVVLLCVNIDSSSYNDISSGYVCSYLIVMFIKNYMH